MPRPENMIHVQVTRLGLPALSFTTELDDRFMQVISRLPKDREIDPREYGRALQQIDERKSLVQHLGGWFARTFLNKVERQDTVNGYAQEGPEPDVEPINFASLGQTLARMIAGTGEILTIVDCLDRTGELVPLLLKYCEEADRYSREWRPGQLPYPDQEAARAVQILKSLTRQ